MASDLAKALRKAPIDLKRQVFEAFCLQVTFDKVARRIEISAVITEAVAEALEKAKDMCVSLWPDVHEHDSHHVSGCVRAVVLAVESHDLP